MTKNRFINIGLVIIIIIIITCVFNYNKYSEKDTKKYLPGTYLYTFPSGEASILIINSDFTFNNKVYSKDKKHELYRTNGTMEPDGRKITFNNFLLFSDHNESDMIFSRPDVGITDNAYWEKPKDSNDISTISFSVYNYIFKKIK